MDLVFFPSELLYCPTQSAGASRCLTNVCGLKGKRKGRKRGRKEGEEKQGMEGGGRGGGRGEKEGERDGREGRKEGGRRREGGRHMQMSALYNQKSGLCAQPIQITWPFCG